MNGLRNMALYKPAIVSVSDEKTPSADSIWMDDSVGSLVHLHVPADNSGGRSQIFQVKCSVDRKSSDDFLVLFGLLKFGWLKAEANQAKVLIFAGSIDQ